MRELELGDIFKVQTPDGKWERVVSVTVAAEMCDVNVRTVRRALTEGSIEGHKAGRLGMDWAVSVRALKAIQKAGGWREGTKREPGRPWHKEGQKAKATSRKHSIPKGRKTKKARRKT
jgi:hypothetical protein